jgi:hypothetical protein
MRALGNRTPRLKLRNKSLFDTSTISHSKPIAMLSFRFSRSMETEGLSVAALCVISSLLPPIDVYYVNIVHCEYSSSPNCRCGQSHDHAVPTTLSPLARNE